MPTTDDRPIYELCPKCDGTGTAQHLDGPKPCDHCTLVRVAPIANVTRETLRAAVRARITAQLNAAHAPDLTQMRRVAAGGAKPYIDELTRFVEDQSDCAE